jgi:hypothetical protein
LVFSLYDQFARAGEEVRRPRGRGSQLAIFAPGRGQRDLNSSARAIIANFARCAIRRPLATSEVERFMYIYGQAGKKGGNFEQSVQTALTAVLVSPHFLFRWRIAAGA